MYLKRKIDAVLEAWRNDPARKPLIVKGSRQVGKTESILHFAAARYESVIEIKDPYSPSQIGWTYWGSWFREHGGRGSPTSNIFYFWSLDENLQPIGVELLKKENKYE